MLFGDDYFVDLFQRSVLGRPTVPARVVTVMLLQAHEGLSDREACDRLAFDLRWKAAAGLPVSAPSFHPTVLVGMRNRLRASDRPRRLFEDVTATARAAGLLRGRRRVLDSTPLYDAVATQDTVIQLRAAIRKLLLAADRDAPTLAAAVRTALARDDEYATLGKPPCDWDDPAAREALVDALVRDCQAALAVLTGHGLPGPVAEAAALLALLAGQDVEAGEDGVFRIARKVARDRVISTVDTEARHGHKSRARTFDGYRAHLGVDPDDELITNVAVTAANTADRAALDETFSTNPPPSANATTSPTRALTGAAGHSDAKARRAGGLWRYGLRRRGDAAIRPSGQRRARQSATDAQGPPVHQRRLPHRPAGRRSAARPGTPPRSARRSGGQASFAPFCGDCPLRAQCTAARNGRKINIHRREATLQRPGPGRRTLPGSGPTATRPIIERKIAHFVRRPWGGRRARCRGKERILTDVLHRGAALNLSRLAGLGLHLEPAGWAVAAR